MTLAEMGEYKRAAQLLEKLTEVRNSFIYFTANMNVTDKEMYWGWEFHI